MAKNVTINQSGPNSKAAGEDFHDKSATIHGGLPEAGGEPPADKAGAFGSFISVTDEEAEAAIILKDLLELFPAFSPSFVGKTSIIAGDHWLTKIKTALASTRLVLVLFSREFFAHHWLHLECGAALSRDLPLIALTIKGLTPLDLPDPYRQYQAANMSSEDGARALIASLQARSSFSPPTLPDVSSLVARLKRI